jgi:predicted acylesterase/phospholipase RssA
MEPLNNIAIAMSGGGYRATTYHLGVLSCLHKASILEKVTMLSSVSGGSITAIKYADSLVEEKSFNEFETEIEKFLKQFNLIENSLMLINTQSTNRKRSVHSLITAFAELYHQHLLSDKTKYFNSFWSTSFNKSHLKELSINATDFHSGNGFRFIRSQSGWATIGNKNLRLVRDDVKKMRTGDILAASSCFPGGFEPIDLLQDFAFDEPFDHKHYEKKWKTKEAPLMDGGIYDNQGMEAIKLAVDRTNNFDTVIISDTDQEDNYPLYKEPNDFPLPNATISDLSFYLSTFFYVVIGCVAFSFFSFLNIFIPAKLAFILILTSFSVFIVWFWSKSNSILSGIKQRIPNQFKPAIKKVDNMNIGALGNALLVRGVSLIKMASTIFMKRVRGQVYESSFMTEKFEGKVVPNLIYEINEASSIDGFGATPYMLEKVEMAKNMPTTLWFTDTNHKQFHALKDTGELTTAYNLIKHIDKMVRSGSLNKKSTIYLKHIRKLLKSVWILHL